MRLLWVIVQAEDADVLIGRLVASGLGVTRINSVGSFLLRGNATLLIGLPDERVEIALSIVRATCHRRKSYINALSALETAPVPLVAAMPLEVQIGGAVVFEFPISRFTRLMGGTAPAVMERPGPAVAQPVAQGCGGEGERRMNLVLAIMQGDDADQVVGGLLVVGYRVTRLNSAGGFLRRGNVTLLIGVDSAQVDDVLQIIQTNIRLRGQGRSSETGMPPYGATVFVLAANRFVQM